MIPGTSGSKKKALMGMCALLPPCLSLHRAMSVHSDVAFTVNDASYRNTNEERQGIEEDLREQSNKKT